MLLIVITATESFRKTTKGKKYNKNEKKALEITAAAVLLPIAVSSWVQLRAADHLARLLIYHIRRDSTSLVVEKLLRAPKRRREAFYFLRCQRLKRAVVMWFRWALFARRSRFRSLGNWCGGSSFLGIFSQQCQSMLKILRILNHRNRRGVHRCSANKASRTLSKHAEKSRRISF